MTDKLNGNYRVHWDSKEYGTIRKYSMFVYTLRGPLNRRFISVCNRIIDNIAINGNIATVKHSAFEDGIVIEERKPNMAIIKIHEVWVEKE